MAPPRKKSTPLHKVDHYGSTMAFGPHHIKLVTAALPQHSDNTESRAMAEAGGRGWSPWHSNIVLCYKAIA
eukprot:1160385-Pelagomonas_calceolata.AAC.5